MISWQDILSDPAPRKHLVQFYREDADLVRNVSLYLAEGARRGDALLVIATPSHTRAFTRALGDTGVAVEDLANQGRLVFLDAEQTLAQIAPQGLPAWSRFDEVIGRRVGRLEAREDGTVIRAYGEMVDLLWQSGRLSAAARIEEFWNRLLRAHDIGLYCAYGIDLLSDETPAALLHSTIRSHSHLIPGHTHAEMEQAVSRAMDEVLGPAAAGHLRPLIQANLYPHADLPAGEATVLWLRSNLAPYADQVLLRARAHYEALCGHGTP
jgi:hypothetical protein